MLFVVVIYSYVICCYLQLYYVLLLSTVMLRVVVIYSYVACCCYL